MLDWFRNPYRDEIAARPERKVFPTNPEDGTAHDDLEPNEFYFEVRLCEVYLRKSGEAGRSFAPRVLAITECLYGAADGSELTLPMAVGQKFLDEIEAHTGESGDGKSMTFTDCLLAGPMPYRGADIGFFGGLYRVERGNWTDSAFNLIADLTHDFGVDISKYTQVGGKLVGGLPALLGIASDDWRFGHYGPLYKESDAFFDRHVVMRGAEDATPVDWGKVEIRAEDGREALYIRSNGSLTPFTQSDFALFRLRSRKKRGDYARFGFNNRFNETKRHLTEKQTERADWSRVQLLQEISDCPDLTEAHKLKLVAMFELKLENWRQSLDPHRGGASGASHRGGAGDGVASAIGATASTAARRRLPRETTASLSKLSKEWTRLSAMPAIAKSDAPSNEEIDAFLNDPQTQQILGGKAVDLADAVKFHILSARP